MGQRLRLRLLQQQQQRRLLLLQLPPLLPQLQRQQLPQQQLQQQPQQQPQQQRPRPRQQPQPQQRQQLQPRRPQPLRSRSLAFSTSRTRTRHHLAVTPNMSTGRALKSLEHPSAERARVSFASLSIMLDQQWSPVMPTTLDSSVSQSPSAVSILSMVLSTAESRSHWLTTKPITRSCSSTRESTENRLLRSLNSTERRATVVTSETARKISSIS